MSESVQEAPEPTPEIRLLAGSPNFRDLGGYRTKQGSTVRQGLVFRSGHLAALSVADIGKLEILGIRMVVDLRHEYEVGLFGEDRLPAQVRRVSLPIATAHMNPSIRQAMQRGDLTALPDLGVASREMIRHRTGPLGNLLRLISRSENLPLVFHCIGGKDRTGVASAILLGLLGVPWPTIREDYLISNEALGSTVEDRLSHLTRVVGGQGNTYPRKEDLEAARRFFVLQPHYIDAALREVNEVAGSIEEYVKNDLGLHDTEVGRIRALLLE